MSGLDRKPFSCSEKLFVVERGEKKKKILFDVWGEGFRGQENVIRSCPMWVSDLSPWFAGEERGCGFQIWDVALPTLTAGQQLSPGWGGLWIMLPISAGRFSICDQW